MPASPTAFAVLDLDIDASLPNGESIDSINIISNVAGDSTANVGSYADDLAPTNILSSSAGFDEGNYDITRVNGDYTIDRRAILLTALDQGKIYGDTDSLNGSSFTITGHLRWWWKYSSQWRTREFCIIQSYISPR